MKSRPKSIYDLAKITGVSYATVSRVLNSRGRTSPETRQAVLRAAAQYNFRPRLKARKTTVALFIDVHDGARQHYIPAMLSALVERLSGHDVAIEIFTKSNLDQFRECHADAVLALPWNDAVKELLCRLENLPKLVVNYPGVDSCSTVASNHEQSGRLAAEHLLAHGHRQAGIIVASRDWGNMQRVAGFQQFYREHGIEIGSRLCGSLCSNSPLLVVNQLLAQKPTAIFIGMEDAVIEIWNILKALKLEIPGDLSLISMENKVYSKFLSPPMTTIDQQLETVAEKAVALIMRKLAASDATPEEVLVDNLLIERQSVLPPTPGATG
ncbi:MAG: LacI family DNA-binding transcriptional regulator [Lentisphaeria bacterium]|jgi:LacI family transcriptional regulator